MSSSTRCDILVYASEVAGAIGSNKYQKPHLVLENVWKRVDAAGYHAATRANKVITDDQRLELLVHDDDALETLVASASEAVPTTSATTAEEVRTLLAQVHVERDEDRRVVEDAIRKAVYVEYGKRSEDLVYDQLKERLFFDIEKRPDFFKKKLGEYRGVAWGMGGRVDAMSTDGKTVVEIKNRVKRLFGKVVEYERVQLESYMALTGAEDGVLCEAYRGPYETPLAIDTHHLDADPAYFENTVVARLRIFCEYLVDVTKDADLQREYFAQKHRSRKLTSKFSASSS